MPESVFLTVETCTAISDIPRADWERLAGRDNPFLRYEFFEALEQSGCTSAGTGWQPCHLMFRVDGRLAGAAPAYLKSHSMGEYVFDWAWADAWQHHGLNYYPKLLIAIPFTPSQGPRLLLEPALRGQVNSLQLHNCLYSLIEQLGAHSWHLLFPDASDQALLENNQQLHRIGCQFHWHNRDYQSFDDFLAVLTSRKRKSIRKERRQVTEQGITFCHFQGQNLPDAVLDAFYLFYQATYLKRGQQPYLNRRFFERVRETMPEHLWLIMAEQNGKLIAGALYFTGKDTLYGRYWGCVEEYDHLHFETCYYQGIELAIRLGLQHFDAGAQGEHKLVRGFEPTLTHSWHGVEHPGFRDAVQAFTKEEAGQVLAYYQEALTLLPFNQNHTP
jgi:predicted N-acyltransferase